MKKILSFIITCSCILALVPSARGQQGQPKPEDMAGEFSGWGVPVSKGNYYFVQGVLRVFGNRWGGEPQTDQELQDKTWEQLVLSFESYRRGVKVEQKDVDDAVDKMLVQDKVSFERAKDQKSYEAWIKSKTNEPREMFENQIRHMLQLDKLRQTMLDSFKVEVSEPEAYQEFLNEYNTLELELVQFDQLDAAKAYYAKMRSPKQWDAAGKADPKFCRKPGFVSLEFLLNMWKIPKDDLYKMMKLEVNSIYPPTPVWKGYGVFRIIKKRPAEDAEFPKLKDSYFKQVEMLKKYDRLTEWLAGLKKEAGIVVYPAAAQPAAAKPADAGKAK